MNITRQIGTLELVDHHPRPLHAIGIPIVGLSKQYKIKVHCRQKFGHISYSSLHVNRVSNGISSHIGTHLNHLKHIYLYPHSSYPSTRLQTSAKYSYTRVHTLTSRNQQTHAQTNIEHAQTGATP